MARNAITTIADMQIVPEKFSAYVTERTTEKSALVGAGIATGDALVGQLINGTPSGGRFITIPAWQPLDASTEEDVFGEGEVSVGGITTSDSRATLLIRQKAWGDTDLARVLGGADPMAAIIDQMADWRNQREQKIYLAILKAILNPTSGALKDHVNDISAATTTGANLISDGATLDTKQCLGDAYGSLGMVFMHSATYTYLQKKGMITRNPIFDPAQSSVEMERYLGYRIIVDDGMPFATYEKTASSTSGALTIVADDTESPTATQVKLSVVTAGGLDAAVGDTVLKLSKDGYIYDTYFLGAGAFIRQDGNPAGLVGTETDRDKFSAKNYLINRWCQVIHPRGFGWVPDESSSLLSGEKYPNNADLAKAANWKLTTHHKHVPIACLRHKIG